MSRENNIETLASLVNMSPRNLSRVFKEHTGSTILEYLTLLRIEYANTMLNNPEYTIEYIASKCGFKSAAAITKDSEKIGSRIVWIKRFLIFKIQKDISIKCKLSTARCCLQWSCYSPKRL